MREFMNIVEDVLTEMIIRNQEDDYNFVVAFQDSIWLLNSQDDIIDEKIIDDIRERTGLYGDDVDELFQDAQDARPDVIAAYVVNNYLQLDGRTQTYQPSSSLLVRKVVKELGLDGVHTQHMGHDDDDFEVEHEKFSIEGKIPDIVYHGTNSRALRGILSTGLNPNTDVNNWKGQVEKFGDRIFLTVDPQTAIFHANHQAQQYGSVAIVVAVKIPDRNKITSDYDVAVATKSPDDMRSHDAYGKTYAGKNDQYATGRAVSKYSPKTNFSREFGVFAYTGRIPASFIRDFLVASNTGDDVGAMTEENAIRLTKQEIGPALDMIEEYGWYNPDFEDEFPDDEEESENEDEDDAWRRKGW